MNGIAKEKTFKAHDIRESIQKVSQRRLLHLHRLSALLEAF